eukprot:364398-Chlamydomonas_euryale.AAC.13
MYMLQRIPGCELRAAVLLGCLALCHPRLTPASAVPRLRQRPPIFCSTLATSPSERSSGQRNA